MLSNAASSSRSNKTRNKSIVVNMVPKESSAGMNLKPFPEENDFTVVLPLYVSNFTAKLQNVPHLG